MRNLFVGLTALSLITSGCTSASRDQDKSASAQMPEEAPASSWAARMQQLSQTLAQLMPLISSSRKFNDPANAQKIEQTTQSLSKLAHTLQDTPKPSADPTLMAVSGIFEADIARALDALRGGHRDYARNVLRDTTSYCIQCHTQTNNGPNFPQLKLDIDMKDLTRLEQAELYAATRQFENALEAYRHVLVGPDLVSRDAFEWENAARSAIAIAVRVKKDPKEALDLVRAIAKNPGVPQQMRASMTSWEASLNEWRREKPRGNPERAETLLKDAQMLVARAQKRQSFPLDHSQDILFFRASSLLHDLLGRDPKADGLDGEERARTLLLAGVAAEATRDMNFWTLHENYYEQCIRFRPGSEPAKQCFNRLKESVTLGYSGSAGTQIPPEELRRLQRFEKIAKGEKQ